MLAALRTPKHAPIPYRSTTHPSTRNNTPSESLNASPSGMSKVGSVISRVLDFTGVRKLNVRWDDKDSRSGSRDTFEDRQKRREGERQAIVTSVYDLQTALQTIPGDDSSYPQTPNFRAPLGKAAQLLGLSEIQEPLAMLDVRAAKLLKEEYFDSTSLASDAAEKPYGPPGAARRHFCSMLGPEDDAHSLFPSSTCCWGGHLGPTYLDTLDGLDDNVSVRSSIAPAPTHVPRPLPTSPASPIITRTPPPIPQEYITFAYYGRDRAGWERERPYPYMMERDVEPLNRLAGRDAVEGYSRYPSIPRRQLVN